MRVIILSPTINNFQKEIPYNPPYDIKVDYCDFTYSSTEVPSLFDYDVVILHFKKSKHTSGYHKHLSSIISDVKVGLNNGIVFILLPESTNNVSEENKPSVKIFDWLSHFGITLCDGSGSNINTAGIGKTTEIVDYIQYSPNYYQVIHEPELISKNKLASVGNTQINVGMELQKENGYIVILPPPKWNNSNYFLVINSLIELAKYYHEKVQRIFQAVESPDWVEQYRIPKAIAINKQISELNKEIEYYRRIEYLLFGTGEQLEYSVMDVLSKFGINVIKQEKGANIDLLCNINSKNIAIEVTGTKGLIRKDTKKIAQAWEYLYSDENARLIIIANTECHLIPSERNKEPYSENVITLLSRNNILLMTTLQLYNLWKKIEEGSDTIDKLIIPILLSKTGLYKE
jgi:hypothetical protein